jgi:hypothetical protein
MQAETILTKIEDYENFTIQNEFIDGDLDIRNLSEKQIEANQKNHQEKDSNPSSPNHIYIKNLNFTKCTFKSGINLFFKEGYIIEVVGSINFDGCSFDTNQTGIAY